MPIYQYINDKTNEIIDIYQGMNDIHKYFDEEGKEWRRLFTAPQASFNTKIDPYSQQQFVNRVEQKKGTLGDVWNYSAEMSEKRAAKDGQDKVKEKYYKKQRKIRGKPCHAEIQERAKKAMDSTFIIG